MSPVRPHAWIFGAELRKGAILCLNGPSSVVGISGLSVNILFFGMMDFPLKIRAEAFREKRLFLREMNRNNLF